MLLRLLMIAALIAVLLGTYVRLAPSDPGQWHVDPGMAEGPGGKGVLMAASESPVWSQPPAEVLAALDAIARATDRTTVLAETPDLNRVTFMTRSLLWGFPDFTSVSAISGDDGTRLAILARARFGVSDLGVNQARVETWLDQLIAVLPPQ